ncbi:MAG: inositol monophosphatase [Intrasporangium sp.]|uniref:inositol monophosphatase family protein n=1 Tax=Intrasporangium sp. TaxID=1925024 RepID=UPI002646FDBE|nr:inositol monophosphatase [Intrasporangium sp.]MDN5797236.1 inositol monophosphatase [Intrasporangium sp.]
MDTDAVLQLLRDVSEVAINPRFRALAEDEVHEKNPGDLVTDADREAEKLITAALLGAYPDAVVLGEEAHSADAGLMDRYLAAEHAFTVDPVDGTKNFVHGSRDHAVMVSETVRGQTVRAWIWQPQHELGYVAERGAGAWCGSRRLRREAAVAPLDGRTSRRAWIGASFGGLPALRLTWVSCGIDYPKLVEGEADYIVYHRAAPWDHVPGTLILREAGGVSGTPDGVAYQPRLRPARGLVIAADAATYDTVRVALP